MALQNSIQKKTKIWFKRQKFTQTTGIQTSDMDERGIFKGYISNN